MQANRFPRGLRGQGRIRSGGFTMVEMIVAIAVMLIAVLATSVAQVSALRLQDGARETAKALADLESAMESVLSKQVETIPVAGSPYQAGQPIAAYEKLHLKNQRIVPSYPGYTAGGVVPDPLTIVLTATWTDRRGAPRRAVLRGMKTR